MNSEFNLITEPWIPVMDREYAIKDISLEEALGNSRNYLKLAGETHALDAAVLRFLLAVTYSVLIRYDNDGFEMQPKDEDEVLDRWLDAWDSGKFSTQALASYFDKYKDRFWLFDEERPFCQIPASKLPAGINVKNVKKLNGAISEGDNKVRMFSERAEERKSELSFPEAARWLLFGINYDDGAIKPSTEAKKRSDRSSIGVGWLGQLGLVYWEGDNLFETLMLNSVLLKRDGHMWDSIDTARGFCANWECDSPRYIECSAILPPKNPAELMMIQSRHYHLVKNGNTVNQFYYIAGDRLDSTNAFFEPMTIWRKSSKTGDVFPKHHAPSVQAWREFPSLASTVDDANQEAYRPGIVDWLNQIRAADYSVLSGRILHLRTVGMVYTQDAVKGAIDDCFSDGLALHYDIFEAVGDVWRVRIIEEVVRCEKVADKLKNMAIRIRIAAGDSGDIHVEDEREGFLAELDQVFREWLVKLDPSTAEEEYSYELRSSVKILAGRYGRRLLEKAGSKAILGRVVNDKEKSGMDRKRYSAAEALEWFIRDINRIYKED